MAVIIGRETSPGIRSGKQEAGRGNGGRKAAPGHICRLFAQLRRSSCSQERGWGGRRGGGGYLYIYKYRNIPFYHTGFPASAQMVKHLSGVFVEVTKPLLSLRRKPKLTEGLSWERLNLTSCLFFFSFKNKQTDCQTSRTEVGFPHLWVALGNKQQPVSFFTPPFKDL